MTPTIRYSPHTRSDPPLEPSSIREGHRLWRILTFISSGPKPTSEVYRAARKRLDIEANRENPQTRKCLRLMEEAGWLVKGDDIEITEAGRAALQGASERRAA